MSIYVGSRYEADEIDRVETPSGEWVATIIHTRTPEVQVFGYSLHVVQYGDRLDTLAAQHFGDPELFWVIANANPEVFYPDQIPVGTVLRIPDARVLG